MSCLYKYGLQMPVTLLRDRRSLCGAGGAVFRAAQSAIADDLFGGRKPFHVPELQHQVDAVIGPTAGMLISRFTRSVNSGSR